MSDWKEEVQILYEDNHLIFVKKPFSFLVQADKTGDEDLLSFLKKYLKSKYNKPGDVFLGLVHRLDRPTAGVMVFAKTSKAAARLSDQIRNRNFEKQYLAIVKGRLAHRAGNLEDYLMKDPKKNVVRVASIEEGGKQALLSYQVLDYKNGYSYLSIHLITGRFHQIRVQFATRGHPLYGDQKYGGEPNAHYDGIALFAQRLTLFHPTKRESLSIACEAPKMKPWTSFKTF